jgi:hypothetical protein
MLIIHSSADFNKFTTTQVQILINSTINVTNCRFSRNQACWPNSIASADFPVWFRILHSEFSVYKCRFSRKQCSAEFPAISAEFTTTQVQQFNIATYSSILQYIAEFPAI